MQRLRLFLLLLMMLAAPYLKAQTISYDSVNIRSYALYEKGNWKELLDYGKTAVVSGQDFLNLRLRLGYAAFMIGNYSLALKHYDKTLTFDRYNATAHYYMYFCNVYLNRADIADAHVKFLTEEVKQTLKLKPISLIAAGIETSYQQPDVTIRGNALYNRVDLSHRLGYVIHMLHSGGLYDQEITSIQPRGGPNRDTTKIAISQKEYYNRTAVNITDKIQLTGAYHYLYTLFNNDVYNNQVGLAAVKYFGNCFDLEAAAIFSRLTDSSQSQFNFTAGIYPLGNLNIYGFSTLSYNPNGNSTFNFKQVAGFKVLKNTWVELNSTFGAFKNFVENDALYVYNAIDRDLFKGGAMVYFTVKSRLLVKAGYTFEQRELYNPNPNMNRRPIANFNQNSITGGLSWKF